MILTKFPFGYKQTFFSFQSVNIDLILADHHIMTSVQPIKRIRFIRFIDPP